LYELAGKLWKTVKRYRAPVIGVLLVLVILGGMLAYSGMWPPVFVVESASMQHSDTESKLGVIDTGDLVLIQGSNGGGVRTYVESYSDGHRSFGDYGDVIIYERYGRSDTTPIIHRAMVRLVYNETANSFDVPSLALLPADKWSGGNEDGRWWNLTTFFEVYDVGYKEATLKVDLASLLDYYRGRDLSHDGFITMGDHNIQYSNGEFVGIYDQSTTTICREPIMDEWVVGEAKQEIPWLGLIKLWVGGDMPANTPENSKTNLVVLLVLLIVLPLAFDITSSQLKKRGIDPWARLVDRLKRKKD
jgi:signal peptidase I